MISLNHLSEVLDNIYLDIKKDISNKHIKFSRIEKCDRQWLLSIVLTSDFTDQHINEIVIETNIDNNENRFIIKTDLSYGNGFILDERSINISKKESNSIHKLREIIQANLYREKDIENAINRLIETHTQSTKTY